jgi:hypothetical protein
MTALTKTALTKTALTKTALTKTVPRMTRVTWYKHRVSMLGIPAVFLLAALLLFVDGILQRQWLSSNHLSGCLIQWKDSGNSVCAVEPTAKAMAWSRFEDSGRTNVIELMALALPAVIALFAGVPWVAREFESGAFRYTWTQTGSPRRWLTGTFTPLVLLAGATAAIFGLAAYWWFQVAQWRSGSSDSLWSWQSFEVTPLSVVSWTLLAMSLALLLGVTIRRVLPAMIGFVAAIIGCVILSQTLLREYLFRIGEIVKQGSFVYPNWPNHFTTYVTRSWYTTHSGQLVTVDATHPLVPSNVTDGNLWLRQHYIIWIASQPHSHLIWFELARSAILVAVAVLAVLASIWWLRHRPAE